MVRGGAAAQAPPVSFSRSAARASSEASVPSSWAGAGADELLEEDDDEEEADDDDADAESDEYEVAADSPPASSARLRRSNLITFSMNGTLAFRPAAGRPGGFAAMPQAAGGWRVFKPL